MGRLEYGKHLRATGGSRRREPARRISALFCRYKPLPLPAGVQGENFGGISISPTGEVTLSFQDTGTGVGPARFGFRSTPPASALCRPALRRGIASRCRRWSPDQRRHVFRNSAPTHTRFSARFRHRCQRPRRLRPLARSQRVYLVYTDDPSGVPPGDPRLFAHADTGSFVVIRMTTAQRGAPRPGQRLYRPQRRVFPTAGGRPTTGNVAVSWYDARNDANDIAVQPYAAVSPDSGGDSAQHSGFHRASNRHCQPDRRNFFGDYSGLDFYGGIIHPLWPDNSNVDGSDFFFFFFFFLIPAAAPPSSTCTPPRSRSRRRAKYHGGSFEELSVGSVCHRRSRRLATHDRLHRMCSWYPLTTASRKSPLARGANDLNPSQILTDNHSFGSTDEHGNQAISIMAAMANNHWGIVGINWTSSVRVAETSMTTRYTVDQADQPPDAPRDRLPQAKKAISGSSSRAVLTRCQPAHGCGGSSAIAAQAGHDIVRDCRRQRRSGWQSSRSELSNQRQRSGHPLASTDKNVISVGAVEQTYTTVSNLENASASISLRIPIVGPT